MKNRKTISLISVIAAAVLGSSLMLAACDNGGKTAAESYVAMDINPSVEFVLDKNDQVISVRAANKDAEVLLYGAEGIIGAKIKDASERISELAIEYGYLSSTNDSVGVTVSGKTEDAEGKILSQIDAGFKASCDKAGLQIRIEREGGFLLNGQLEKLKAQYPDNADIQALTAGKYRLILAAMKIDKTLTLERAAAMSAKELSGVLYNNERYHLEVVSDRMEEIYEKLELEYEQKEDALLDGAYLTLLDNGADRAVRAAEYVALRTAYRAVEKIEEIDLDIQPVLTDEQLTQIAEMIGQNAEEFIAEVKAYGAATEEAVEYYLDRLYRNMNGADRHRYEEVYEAAEDLLEEIEEAAETVSAEILEKVRTALAPVAEYMQIELDRIREADDLEEYVLDRMEERIEDLEDWFERNLSAEEKKEVSDKRQELHSEIETLRSELRQAMEDLKAEAERELQALQQARIEAAA